MSCIRITPEMRSLLEALRTLPPPPEVLARLKEMTEWDQALEWGWIMKSGDLTGMGARHAPGGIGPKGIIA